MSNFTKEDREVIARFLNETMIPMVSEEIPNPLSATSWIIMGVLETEEGIHLSKFIHHDAADHALLKEGAALGDSEPERDRMVEIMGDVSSACTITQQVTRQIGEKLDAIVELSIGMRAASQMLNERKELRA